MQTAETTIRHGRRLIELRVKITALQRAAELACEGCHDDLGLPGLDTQRVRELVEAIDRQLAATQSPATQTGSSKDQQALAFDRLQVQAARLAADWMRGPALSVEPPLPPDTSVGKLLFEGRYEEAGHVLLARATAAPAQEGGLTADAWATLAARAFSFLDDPELVEWRDCRRRHDEHFRQWHADWAKLDELLQDFGVCAETVNELTTRLLPAHEPQLRLRRLVTAPKESPAQATVEYMHDEERCAEVQALLEVIREAGPADGMARYKVPRGRYAEMVRIKSELPQLQQASAQLQSLQSACRESYAAWWGLRTPAPAALDRLIGQVAAAEKT